MEASLTVVVVTHNSGVIVGDCLERLSGSSLSIEIIVVDNGSDRENLALLRAFTEKLVGAERIENRENVGFSAANNIALRKISTDFVLLLNPDCLVESDTIEQLYRYLMEHGDVAMAGCLIRNMDGSEQQGGRRNLPTYKRLLVQYLGLGRWLPARDTYLLNQAPLPDKPVAVEAISGALMMVRRSAIAEVGLLDERYFLHWEDLDWCKRFYDAGQKIAFIPQVVVTHIKGTSSERVRWRVELHKHFGMLRYFWTYNGGLLMLPVSLLLFTVAWARTLLRAAQLSSRR
ncbi:MAG: glycosyltransferase family 2 protein [Gammaproteobacteria bacterium]|nr:glycosyltransferase family 2 protein [Gammaproteobacteria bacterium]